MYRYAALALTTVSLLLSVGFPITIALGIVAVFILGISLCTAQLPPKAFFWVAAACALACSLGNWIVAVTAGRMAYCEADFDHCDTSAWKILGAVAGVLWFLSAPLIVLIPAASSKRVEAAVLTEPVEGGVEPLSLDTRDPSLSKKERDKEAAFDFDFDFTIDDEVPAPQ